MLPIILILFVLVAGFILVNFVFSESKVEGKVVKPIEVKKWKPEPKPKVIVEVAPTIVDTKPKKTMKEKKEKRKETAKALIAKAKVEEKKSRSS